MKKIKKNKLKTSLNLFENLSKNKKNLMRLNAKKLYKIHFTEAS